MYAQGERKGKPGTLTLVLAQLKPICVELLGLSSSAAKRTPTANASLVQQLEKLRTILEQAREPLQRGRTRAKAGTRTGKETPFSVSLIHYVFFPLAQLLRGLPLGVASLPDRAREHVFAVLECLARDWYQEWTDASASSGSKTTADQRREKWQVWEQLLILGASALGGPPSKSTPVKSDSGSSASSSDETLAAVAAFLESLLLARAYDLNTLETSEETWEWDGETELPSLDDYDGEETKALEGKVNASNGSSQREALRQQMFPSRSHIDYIQGSKTSKGALAHALTAALDVACSTDLAATRDYSPSLRTACLRLARLVLWTWIAGIPEIHDDLAVLALPLAHHDFKSMGPHERMTCAQRTAVFLPGFVSSLTRLLSSNGSRQADTEGLSLSGAVKKPRTTLPGHLVSEALDALRDVLNLCVDDSVAKQLLPDGHLSTVDQLKEEGSEIRRLTELETLIEGANIDDGSQSHFKSMTEEETGPEEKQQKMGDANNSPAEEAGTAGISETWLRNTMIRIHVALVTISPIVQHSHSLAQLAAIRLAAYMPVGCLLASSLELQRSDELPDPDETDIIGLLLVWLLDLAASPDTSIKVRDRARQQLLQLMSAQDNDRDARIEIQELRCKVFDRTLENTLRQLPRVIHGQRDEAVTQLARRLSLLIRLLSGGLGGGSIAPSATLLSLFQPTNLSGARGWNQSTWLDIVQVQELDTQEVTHSGQQPRLANLDALASNALLDALCELGQACGRFLLLGGANEIQEDPTAVIHLFLREAARTRTGRSPMNAKMTTSRTTSVSALVIAEEMLRGVAQVLDDAKTSNIAGREGKRVRKTAHRLAKTVIRQVVEVWEADQEEMLSLGDDAPRMKTEGDEGFKRATGEMTRLQNEHSYRDNVIIEQHGRNARLGKVAKENGRDLQGFGPALDLSSVMADGLSLSDKDGTPTKAMMIRKAHTRAASSLRQGDAFLLSMLGSAAIMLGPLVRSSLLPILYPVISAVAASSPLVQNAAANAMQAIAHSAAYASVEGCVLDHADYILGAASHRLVAGLGTELEAFAAASFLQSRDSEDPVSALTRTSPQAKDARHQALMSAQSAPLVLVEVIRMLGPEAVPLVEDAVDEVLDALDRFHGVDELCDGLLQVMDRLVEVMVPQSNPTTASTGKKSSVGRGHETRSDAQSKDLDDFEQWFRERKGRSNVPSDEGKAFDEIMDEVEEKRTGGQNGYEEVDQEEGLNGDPPMTRPQAVVSSIMSKTIPFLSHASPVIRARCLGLLARGVAILGPQDRPVELLAVVERAWPLIMARLGYSKSKPLPSLHAASFSATANLDEREPFVWTEAVRLIGELATHLSKYLGPRKLIDEAWQRISRLLRHAEMLLASADAQTSGLGLPKPNAPRTFLIQPSLPPSSSAATTVAVSTEAATKPTTALQKATIGKDGILIWPAYGPYTTFLCSALSALCRLVDSLGTEQASLQTNHALAIALNPTILSCADKRQPTNVREAALKLFKALSAYNADLVWFVIVDQSLLRRGDEDFVRHRDISWMLDSIKL